MSKVKPDIIINTQLAFVYATENFGGGNFTDAIETHQMFLVILDTYIAGGDEQH